MNTKKKTYDCGVIVGRFQIPDLHEAHKDLIQTVVNNHQKVIIFLGLSPIFDINDPLDFEARKQMILEHFPNVIVAYVPDLPSDESWSKALDVQIGHLTGANQTVVLYGSRDSFLTRYSGKYEKEELIQDRWVSGSEIRAMVKNQVKASKDFRHGAIWQTWQRFPSVYPTVDIAVYDRTKREILLAQKANEKQWRFVGGFADPKDDSYEIAAIRELREEVPNIDVGGPNDLIYAGSTKINDWRYANKVDKIITHLFIGTYLYGNPTPADDIAAVRWFNIDTLNRDEVILSIHRPLWDLFMKKVVKLI